MPEVVSSSFNAGLASITSYNLEWNQGSGTAFVEVVGGATGDSTDQTVTEATLTPGTSYIFRYRVKNIHGWSAGYSPSVTIMAAKVPDTPATATTAISGTNVVLTWAAPDENGATILSYIVEIQGSDAAWYLETTYCDGSNPDTVAAASCTLPQTILTDATGSFVLTRADLVAARISATNILGTGSTSTPNTVGARI